MNPLQLEAADHCTRVMGDEGNLNISAPNDGGIHGENPVPRCGD
jgi:hypothetical protein